MIEKLRLPFPMLSDEDRSRVVAPLGLANPDDRRNLAYPAIVVVTPKGEEAFRWESHEYAFRLPEDEVIEVLESLRLPPVTQPPPELGPAEPGPSAMPLRAMLPYLRGARFAAIALRNRHPEIAADVDGFVEQVDRYSRDVRELRDRVRDEAGTEG